MPTTCSITSVVGSSSVTNAVHQLLLSRLDATPAPTVRLCDLLPHSESSWRPLLTSGVLVEADTPDEIQVAPARFLAVQKVGNGFVGFDSSEDYPTPQPLSRDDVTEYRVVIPALLVYLRNLNSVDGRTAIYSSVNSGIHVMGRKTTANGVVHVWLALALGSRDVIAARLALLAQENSHSQHLVVFPIWPAIESATTTALSKAGVLLADLDPESLVVRWPITLNAEPTAIVPEYALTWNGDTWRVDFLGDHTSVKETLGLTYIALLMSTPDGAWTPLELQNGRRTSEAGTTEAMNQGLSVRSHTQSDLAKASPHDARMARLKVASDRREIEQLREQGRTTEADELEEITDALESKNVHIFGLHGRTRFEGEREKARIAVRSNVERTLKAIEGKHQAIGRALRSRLHLGTPLSFNPQSGERWHVRLPQKIRTSRPKLRK